MKKYLHHKSSETCKLKTQRKINIYLLEWLKLKIDNSKYW